MTNKDSSESILDLLEADDAKTLEKTAQFQEVLTALRYEGKASLGKNLASAREVLGFFKQELTEHVALEEEVLFPFLKTHFPKLEPVLTLLQAEHENFRRSTGTLESQIQELSNKRTSPSRGESLEKIRETGTYLIFLLQTHLLAEREALYKVIDGGLSRAEQERLRDEFRGRSQKRR